MRPESPAQSRALEGLALYWSSTARSNNQFLSEDDFVAE